MKQVIWMGIGYQLEHVQEGVDPDDWRPMPAVGPGVREIRVQESSGAFRCIYLAKRPEAIYVLHSKRRRSRAVGGIWTWQRRFKAIQVKS